MGAYLSAVRSDDPAETGGSQARVKAMNYRNLFAFERLFDRAIAVVLISLGALVAGATALAGA